MNGADMRARVAVDHLLPALSKVKKCTAPLSGFDGPGRARRHARASDSQDCDVIVAVSGDEVRHVSLSDRGVF